MWLHFWSVAVYDLRLTPEQFYQLTPRQLDALLKRHKSRLHSNELLFAQIASAIYNTGFKSPEKPTSPVDFMPSQWAKKSSAQSAKTTHSASKSSPRVRMTTKRRQAVADGLRQFLFPIAKVMKAD